MKNEKAITLPSLEKQNDRTQHMLMQTLAKRKSLENATPDDQSSEMSFYYQDEVTKAIKKKKVKKEHTVVIPEQEMLQIKGQIEVEMKTVLQKEMRAAMFKFKSPTVPVADNLAELTFKTDQDKYYDQLINIQNEETLIDGTT